MPGMLTLILFTQGNMIESDAQEVMFRTRIDPTRLQFEQKSAALKDNVCLESPIL